ncbi:hypothetical protein VOLCADRAFT_107123 [Volvox carteri f. nagariensis]|uniref:K Homology domain-containing protein n=1 Tax=Volvox carteri f. nagariensis TaxID=3068 RepID=D8UC24_VOLCA|nr:uncharacterized protein VOLCADRAFT_107123 [Volvox carteri f. nagariensis]EFJ42721.1 hypothetical protein VOLCADRAFT_107123 [Volvox carteri f. nagariensis]|eukprot:XP_002956182.1 hypothetical protein VOLCADRAFT_107123 [Volvox carteri f. nagariensis]
METTIQYDFAAAKHYGETKAAAILGQRGKLVNRVRQLTGATISYRPEDHRVDINGSPRVVGAAAQLLERTLEHYQYSGLQFTRKQINNVLSPELSEAPALQLRPYSRPITTVFGQMDGFVICPVQDDSATAAAAAADGVGGSAKSKTSRTSFGAIGGDGDGDAAAAAAAAPPSTRLLQLASGTDACLQQLLDLAAEISVQHPADCDCTEIRLYLGKLVLTDVVSSARVLTPEALSGWSFQRNARTVFETSLPQETIRSLDRYLASRGLTPTHQSKSASLHLESSINWIQYHPTFAIGPGGQLRLSKLETLGCKPMTVALVGPPDRTDVRLRYVASVQHGEDDPVAAELRRRQAEFSLVNNVQVSVAAVVDNLGGKRLEVTVSCPELNATLMEMHRNRREAPGARELLAAQLKSLLGHIEDLRRNVEFEP